jgi:hypothetical protein
MKKLVILVAALMLVSVQAFGFSYTYYDFGQDHIFDHNNNWAPISYPYGIGHQPSPGSYNPGGEAFDLEGLNVAVDQDFVYVSLTNSFGYSQEGFRLGDLFIGVDGGNKYQYAVDLTAGGNNTGLYQVNSWNYIQQDPHSYYSNSTIRNAAGAHEMAQGNLLGSVNSMMTFAPDLETNYMSPGNGDTYVWELKFDRSLLGNFNSLSFHVNVGCGNDLMEENFTTAVPEPGTMLLFGLGLLGTGIVRRRKK